MAAPVVPVRNPAGPSATLLRLLTLARDNKAAEIKAQVAAGVDVNQGNAINQTALHIACLHGAACQLEGLVAASC